MHVWIQLVIMSAFLPCNDRDSSLRGRFVKAYETTSSLQLCVSGEASGKETTESACKGKILWNTVESKGGKKRSDDAEAEEKPWSDDQEMKLTSHGGPRG